MPKSGFALLVLAGLVSGCARDAAEPPLAAGIPYACDGRAPIRVSYSGGGARAKAWLWMDGQTLEMASAPTLDGLRYMKPVAPEDTQTLAWATDGVEGTLLEVPVGAMGGAEDKLVANCRREGWDAAGASAEREHEHGATH